MKTKGHVIMMKRALALLLVFLLPAAALADERYSEIADLWVAWGRIMNTVAVVAGTQRELPDADALERGNYYTIEASLLVWIDSDGNETEIGYGQLMQTQRLPRGGISIRLAVEREAALEYLRLPDGSVDTDVPERLLTDPVVVEEREDGTLMRQIITAYDFVTVIVPADGVIPDQTFRTVQFSGASYYVAQDLSGFWGLIDENSVWILPPIYDDIGQFYRYFCLREDDTVDVFREDSLELVGNYPAHPDLFSVESLNAAVFKILAPDARVFYSWETGDELFRIPLEEGEIETDVWSWNENNLYLNPQVRIYGHCNGYALGDPTRLIRQDKETEWYALIDLSGKQLTEEYQLLELLIWNQDRGYYLFGSYRQPFGDHSWDYSSRPERYSSTFRCGIMDQDGNIVLEAEYTDITVLSPRELLLWQGSESEIWTIPE